MRFRHTALLCAAALIPALASAGPASNAAEFGAVEAVVDFCSRVDPSLEKQFQRQAKLTLPKMTDDGLEDVRHTSQYRQAYQLVESVLKQLSLTDAARDCAALIQTK
jgi:hypothetical protein